VPDPQAVERRRPSRRGHLQFAHFDFLGEVMTRDPTAADAIGSDREQEIPDPRATVLGKAAGAA